MDFLERMQKVIELLDEARQLTAGSPLDYYLKKLVEHSDALLTKYAPIKKGERAVIVTTVPCKGGWKDAHETLKIGAVGTVTEVDWFDGSFCFDWLPDKEWYLDLNGKWKETSRPHTYCLHERYLRRQGKEPPKDHGWETYYCF